MKNLHSIRFFRIFLNFRIEFKAIFTNGSFWRRKTKSKKAVFYFVQIFRQIVRFFQTGRKKRISIDSFDRSFVWRDVSKFIGVCRSSRLSNTFDIESHSSKNKSLILTTIFFLSVDRQWYRSRFFTNNQQHFETSKKKNDCQTKFFVHKWIFECLSFLNRIIWGFVRYETALNDD